jgi:CheY-like chemotaxis protein
MSHAPVVVVAEDDDEDFELTREAFRQSVPGVELRRARDGEELLRAVAAMADDRPPALVLLDLNMPRKDGRQALRELRQDPRLRLVPVVTLTNSSNPDDVEECYRLGANSYVRKPLHFAELVEVFRTLKEFWLETCVLPYGLRGSSLEAS